MDVPKKEEPMPDEIREERHQSNMDRRLYDGERISYYRIRANDLPNNKDLMVPGPVNIKREMDIQNKRSVHQDKNTWP